MIKLQLLWKLKPLSSTYSWPKSYEKFCAWISQFAAGVYWSCAAWIKLEGFHILTVNNYQLSKIKTETPTNKCSFQSKQTTCSFICFPIMEQHCLSITSFVPLRIRQLSESIDWFCPIVWSFCVGVSVLLYCIRHNQWVRLLVSIGFSGNSCGWLVFRWQNLEIAWDFYVVVTVTASSVYVQRKKEKRGNQKQLQHFAFIVTFFWGWG